MFQAQIRTTIVSSGGRTIPSPRRIARREPPTRVEVLFALLLFDSIVFSLYGMSRAACFDSGKLTLRDQLLRAWAVFIMPIGRSVVSGKGSGCSNNSVVGMYSIGSMNQGAQEVPAPLVEEPCTPLLSDDVHQDLNARATTAKQTTCAPDANRTRDTSFAVAPVVMTSSTTRMRFVFTPVSLPKA